MSTTHDSIQEATDELRRQQKLLQSLRGKFKNLTTKATSKDGMVTVTTGGKGEVASITFNTQKFRKMAPAELGAVLVETIGRASAQRREQVLAAYGPLLPGGGDLEKVLAGKVNLNEMFDDAVRKVSDITPGGRRGDVGAQPVRKG